MHQQNNSLASRRGTHNRPWLDSESGGNEDLIENPYLTTTNRTAAAERDYGRDERIILSGRKDDIIPRNESEAQKFRRSVVSGSTSSTEASSMRTSSSVPAHYEGAKPRASSMTSSNLTSRFDSVSGSSVGTPSSSRLSFPKNEKDTSTSSYARYLARQAKKDGAAHDTDNSKVPSTDERTNHHRRNFETKISTGSATSSSSLSVLHQEKQRNDILLARARGLSQSDNVPTGSSRDREHLAAQNITTNNRSGIERTRSRSGSRVRRTYSYSTPESTEDVAAPQAQDHHPRRSYSNRESLSAVVSSSRRAAQQSPPSTRQTASGLLNNGALVEDDVRRGRQSEKSSRELRAQRLRSNSRTRKSSSVRSIPGNSQNDNYLHEKGSVQEEKKQHRQHHFTAHSPAVEQYLQRNKEQKQQQGSMRSSEFTTTKEQVSDQLSSKKHELGHDIRNYSQDHRLLSKSSNQSSSVELYLQRSKQQKEQHRIMRGSNSTTTEIARTKQHISDEMPSEIREQGDSIKNPQERRSLSSSSKQTQLKGDPGRGGEWSTIESRSTKKESTRKGNTTTLEPDVMKRKSKVDEYLTLRSSGSSNAPTVNAPSGRTPKRSISASQRQALALIAGSHDEESALQHNPFKDGDESSTSSKSSSTSSSSDEEGQDDSSFDDDTGKEWSVRICVISAVDFPSNVVPNLPFSPILKVGLIKLPVDPKQGNLASPTEGTDAASKSLSELASKLERVGLVKAVKSRDLRMRCTDTKILAKRDAGSTEFHEEMRWDRVVHPYRMAICLELSARAAQVPVNSKESPPSQKVESAMPTPQLASIGTNSSSNTHLSIGKTNSTDSGSGISGGIGSVFRRQPQHPYLQRKLGGSEMEHAQAAAVLAQHLVEQDSETTGTSAIASEGPYAPVTSNGKSSISSNGHQSEMNVKLRYRKKTKKRHEEAEGKQQERRLKKAKFTEDVRLGSQLIPLTKLDLEKALKGKQAARIEQWFELETSTVSPTTFSTSNSPQTSSNTSASRKRNPSILLEISFSTPEMLDDSEDDIEDDSDNDATDSAKHANKEGVVSQTDPRVSFSRRASIKIRNQLKQEQIMSMTESSTTSGGSGTPKQEDPDKKLQPKVREEPVLEPGIIDYVCVVGARDIGDQKSDDGSRGWVNTYPELCVLEQFPPASETGETLHTKHGRTNVGCLLDKVEWFCFPEGCRLWRGSTPPNHEELNLSRFSASSPSRQAASIASFDACLNCTSSFSWFVLASNSDEYGSEQAKTYGACLRFYVPAPTGIDPTQDDFAQTMFADMGAQFPADTNGNSGPALTPERQKRLWVPLGICLTSTLPIVGAMEVMLLRICETLMTKGFSSLGSNGTSSSNNIMQDFHNELCALTLHYQKPVHGIVHCSYPFLHGERIHLNLTPSSGLPALPHGHAVNSVCRLLGADGICHLLAAALTECKILIHSTDVANLCLVAEVITGLIYPFTWSLPYIPVLPIEMMEFIEAPLSYLLGVPTCNMHLISADVLEDIVVVDLDRDFGAGAAGSDFHEGQQRHHTVNKGGTKVPIPLPASATSNISKAVYRLLRAEEEVEETFLGGLGSDATNAMSTTVGTCATFFPRMEPESMAEREFRLAVAIEVCGFVRGYQDCLVYAGGPNTPPVFSVDKFLQSAPALFEEQRGTAPVQQHSKQRGPSNGPAVRRVLSPRSRRFLSLLVNCQHFHQFLEGLEIPDPALSFFHEIVNVMEQQRAVNVAGKNVPSRATTTPTVLGLELHKAVDQLSKSLQKLEDKIPTYRVKKPLIERMCAAKSGENNTAVQNILKFPKDLLQQIIVSQDGGGKNEEGGRSDSGSDLGSSIGVKQISLEYLIELENNPWRYQRLFDIPLAAEEDGFKIEKIKLVDAMGERKYKAWKMALDQERLLNDQGDGDHVNELLAEDGKGGNGSMMPLDLTSLLTSTTDDMTSLTSSDCSILSGGSDTNIIANSTKPSQRRISDAKDREILRRCLERAKGSQQAGTTSTDPFKDSKGRDLVSEAEMALRNPSARRFLLSILNKRTTAKETEVSQAQRRTFVHSSSSTKTSKLDPTAFEVLVRLGYAMLDACMEAKDYEAAYQLLQLTVGMFATLTETSPNIQDQVCVIYMTARIGLHPIYADLGVWERVKDIHLAARQESSNKHDRKPNDSSEAMDGGVAADDVYEAAVATLYEMLGYGIPAEELARFASRVSEQNGWFRSERGQTILLLARRLCIRRDQGTGNNSNNEDAIATSQTPSKDTTKSSPLPLSSTKKSDLEMMSQRTAPILHRRSIESTTSKATIPYGFNKYSEDEADQWLDIGWCHPAAQSSRSRFGAESAKSRIQRPGTQNLLKMLDEQNLAPKRAVTSSGSKDYMKRSAITSMSYLGSGVVASGGLDGGVFLARRIALQQNEEADSAEGSFENNDELNIGIRGFHLDWGSSGSRYTSGVSSASALSASKSNSAASSISSSLDGEYGVGAVSCLAATDGGSQYHHSQSSLFSASPPSKDVLDTNFASCMSDDDLLASMEGCRVVAGTTCGDLRVWSIKDVFAAIFYSSTGESPEGGLQQQPQRHYHRGGEGHSSSYVAGRSVPKSLRGGTDYAAGSSLTRLKFSLRGRALSGHRGGVSCIDVPSAVYRPDSVVSGGADGLIKLWSLRAPVGSTMNVSRRRSNGTSGGSAEILSPRSKATRSGDALSILSGHGGRVLCVKTAWHGDRLLSGGADRTVRVWDLATAGNSSSGSSSGFGSGKCLHALQGHFGWVTAVHYWGPNTIVSASTDRSIALWDARVRKSPLFMLRHHYAPITDVLVGSRTDPLMISAASDGTVAAWDFRHLSGQHQTPTPQQQGQQQARRCNVVRDPVAKFYIHDYSTIRHVCGPIRLSKVPNTCGSSSKTVLILGSDAVTREWDVNTGEVLSEHVTGHCDTVSRFCSLQDDKIFDTQLDSSSGNDVENGCTKGLTGTITTSWDGTIRMRTQRRCSKK